MSRQFAIYSLFSWKFDLYFISVFDLEDVHDDDGRAFYMSDDENDDTDGKIK